jgi:hypothetical protein
MIGCAIMLILLSSFNLVKENGSSKGKESLKSKSKNEGAETVIIVDGGKQSKFKL